jgi:rfaE bifunctional protein nucleotidyltransferase chain/domain
MQLDAHFLEHLNQIHTRQQKIVLATGVFDVLHHAHRQFLMNAKKNGDMLLVGLESDRRVKMIKGPDRPINNQQKRKQQLEELGIADVVFVLPEQFSTKEDRIALIQLIKPAVLAVSSHSPHQEAKQAIMSMVGGKLEVVMEHDPSISTTHLIEQQK